MAFNARSPGPLGFSLLSSRIAFPACRRSRRAIDSGDTITPALRRRSSSTAAANASCPRPVIQGIAKAPTPPTPNDCTNARRETVAMSPPSPPSECGWRQRAVGEGRRNDPPEVGYSLSRIRLGRYTLALSRPLQKAAENRLEHLGSSAPLEAAISNAAVQPPVSRAQLSHLVVFSSLQRRAAQIDVHPPAGIADRLDADRATTIPLVRLLC